MTLKAPGMLTILQPDSRSRRRATAGVVLRCALLALLVPAAVSRAQTGSPRETLEQHGLWQLGTAAIWITASEQRLRESLAPLSSLSETIELRAKEINERIDVNNANRLLLKQKKAQLKDAKGEAKKRLRQQVEMLEAAGVDPEKLGDEPEVRDRLIQVMLARDELLIAVQDIRVYNALMHREYARLAADPRIAAALEARGEGSRLGPAKDYLPELEALPKCEQLVLTETVPMFLQGELARVSGIVNDRTPLTFTWEPSGDRVLITYSMAELAGIDASQGETVKVAERNLPARRVRLASLRFGRHVLRNVEALVLPPEGEDLGARIGPKVFRGFSAAPQPEHLQLLIQARK